MSIIQQFMVMVCHLIRVASTETLIMGCNRVQALGVVTSAPIITQNNPNDYRQSVGDEGGLNLTIAGNTGLCISRQQTQLEKTNKIKKQIKSNEECVYASISDW